MARPKGQTPRLVPFSFAFDPRDGEKLALRCKQLNRTASWVIREAIARYLDAPLDREARRALPMLGDGSARKGAR